MSRSLEVLVGEVLARRRAGAVLLVAIDGEGGSGKSTLADAASRRLGAAVVRTDDFFEEMPIERRRSIGPEGGVVQYYDLTRLRREALGPLLAGRPAAFLAYDWYGTNRLDRDRRVEPSEVVILEGVGSACPELADLVDLAVYVATEPGTRRRRLEAREMAEPWDERWLAAERSYFSRTRPPSSFELVLDGAEAARTDRAGASSPGRPAP